MNLRRPQSQLRRATLLAVVSMAASTACSAHQNSSVPLAESPVMAHASPSAESRARDFVDELARGDWAHSRTSFDEAVSKAMPPAKLRALWVLLETHGGLFRSIDG